MILDDTRSLVSDDSDNDSDFVPGKCRLKGCKEDIFAACVERLALLCYDHFVEDVNSCTEHGEKSKQEKRKQKTMTIEEWSHVDTEISSLTPESFTVEGEQREVNHTKKVRVNKEKEAKKGILERNI